MSISDKPTSEKRAAHRKRFLKGTKVNRSVIHHYEKLVRETRGCFVEKTGADYRIAPTVGTSPLLIRYRAARVS